MIHTGKKNIGKEDKKNKKKTEKGLRKKIPKEGLWRRVEEEAIEEKVGRQGKGWRRETTKD